MKNKRFVFTIIASALFSGILLLGSTSHAADLKTGEKLYKGKCAICHGDQGQGGSALKINDPKVLSKTDGDIRKFINEGGKGMPGYKSSLKPEEIDSLMLLIRSWGSNNK